MDKVNSIRLDRAVSQVTDLSRVAVKRAAKQGRITVNHIAITNSATKVLNTDYLCLDGRPLQEAGPRYFILNKPPGYICATKDSNQSSVLDLLEETNKRKLHIAGRLDIDTTGLVLITDDGQWSHRVTSPRYQCEKIYHAQLASAIDSHGVAKFAQGIWLKNDNKRTHPAKLEILLDNAVRITITEGRYHQVKRMFAAIGNRVVKLHRERVGEIILEESLPEGEYRPLTAAEVASVNKP